MRCCGSGLVGQLQPSGHEYGAKGLEEEKGLKEEKGAIPVWGYFCSGEFFRPLLVSGRWLVWGRRAQRSVGSARVCRLRMRLLDFVLVMGQRLRQKGEIAQLNQQKGLGQPRVLAGPQPCVLEMQLWKAGRGGGFT